MGIDRAWLDAWWAEWLHAPVADLRSGGVALAEHLDHVGILALAHGTAALVYGPSRWVSRLLLAEPQPLESTLTEVVDQLSPDVSAVLGPAWYAYASVDTLVAAPCAYVRRLGPEDTDAVTALRRRVSEAEWDESGMSSGATFGWLEAGTLLAAVSVGDWRGMPSVGVITDPARRGEGLGRAVVSAAVEDRLRTAELVQYRAWVGNAASIALAQRVGFQTYGHAVVIDVARG